MLAEAYPEPRPRVRSLRTAPAGVLTGPGARRSLVAMTEDETVIVHVDERTRRAVEAILHSLGLTPSQFFSLLMEAIAHDEIFAQVLVKEARLRAPPPIIPNAETVEAIEAAQRGEMKTFATLEELFADLNSDADD
jgi:DNA-damage-inducible protein J